MKRFTRSFCLCALLAWCSNASAQATSSQSFRLRIPGILSIIPDNQSATIVHSLQERDQRFGWETWNVANQNGAGAVVTFQTDQAFTHESNLASKRDVRIDLGKRRSPRWRITDRRDQTNYQAGDETAVVRAESNRPGAGEFRLRITFIEETLDTLESGDYEITIVGTLVPK